MKVVLTQDVKDLGKAGQLVNVSEGHARNFLLPRKLARPADVGQMKNLATQKKSVAVKADRDLTDARAVAERLNNTKIVIKAKTGSGTRLYGSVTNQEIADALKAQQHIIVDKRKIVPHEPIKSLGTFEVPIKLHHDVSALIHVEVVGLE